MWFGAQLRILNGGCGDMFKLLNQWQQQRQAHKHLLAFLDEIEKNLELFYVIDQRQFVIRGFVLEMWDKVKGIDTIKRHESIAAYANALADFNQAFQSWKDYERWYTSDTQHKTPDNARKLHTLKNGLDKILKGLEAIIIPAGQALEKEMLGLGLLKN